MNDEILEYQRSRAFTWLQKKLEESSEPGELDQALDALVRKLADLPEGKLYGFVRIPKASQDQSPGSTVSDSQIKALRKTYIKRKGVASSYLNDNEKISVKSGTIITVAEVKQNKNQHSWIRLKNGHEGFIYTPHWEFPANIKNNEVKLKVPYFSQRDNWDKYQGPGWRQCCLTSHCMAADFLLKGEISRQAEDKGYKEPEDLYGEVLAKYGDTTNPQAHTPTLKDFGIDSYFSHTGSIKDLLLCLDKGIPVPLGVAYKAGGHYVCAVGHKADGVYIHDPYGIRMGMTDNYENTSGAYDFVTWDWLQAKWVDQGSEAGWMRVITAVKGKSTGIPGGL